MGSGSGDRAKFTANLLAMGAPVHTSDTLKESGPHAAMHLAHTGTLEVMRVTKAIPTANGDLLFLGVPARTGSSARSLHVSFTQQSVHEPPTMDPMTGRIHLSYPHRDHPEVQALLNSKRNRFCYFWRSASGDRTHAWLLSSK